MDVGARTSPVTELPLEEEGAKIPYHVDQSRIDPECCVAGSDRHVVLLHAQGGGPAGHGKQLSRPFHVLAVQYLDMFNLMVCVSGVLHPPQEAESGNRPARVPPWRHGHRGVDLGQVHSRYAQAQVSAW